jgi:hypothetical protein
MDITERLHSACTGYQTAHGLPTHDNLLMEAIREIIRLRELLRRAAEEPNIDKARAIADAEFHEPNACYPTKRPITSP